MSMDQYQIDRETHLYDESLLIINGNDKTTLEYAISRKLPAIVITKDPEEIDFYFRYIYEDVSEIDDLIKKRTICRYSNLPLTINENDIILLKEISFKDSDELFNIYNDIFDNDSIVSDIFSLHDNFSRNELLNAIIDYTHNTYAINDYGIYNIILKETGKIIGQCGIYEHDGVQYAMYYILESYRKRNIATNAISLMLSYLKKYTDIKDIHVEITEENLISLKIAEKYGFILHIIDSG